jgi:hypothetical protein
MEQVDAGALDVANACSVISDGALAALEFSVDACACLYDD